MSRIKSDPRNANRGTQRGRDMLEQSLREYGAGRSVLVDKHGTLIAGNKTHEVATEIGLPVRIIETNGNELVVVQRTDLDLGTDRAAIELGIADNRVGEVSLEWDIAMLAELAAEDADANADVTKFWDEAELAALIGHAVANDEPSPDEPYDPSQDDASPQLGDIEYRIVIECTSEEHQAELLVQLESEGLLCRALMS